MVGEPGTKGRLTRVRVSVVEGPEGWGTGPEGEQEADPEPGTTYRVAWQALGFLTWSLRGERVQEIEVVEGGGCRFSSWETMRGPLASVVRVSVGAGLDRAFERFVGEVRGWCEGRGKGEDGEGKGEGVGAGVGDGRGRALLEGIDGGRGERA